MPTNFLRKRLWKVLKISGISLGALLALLFLLPMLFPNVVSSKIKGWANNSITGELNFSKARLSFFKHFPSLTLTLYDFNLKGSAPFKQDTLVSAEEVGLGIDLSSVFSDKIKVDKLFLSQGKVHIMVDSTGHPNYNVYKSTDTAKNSKDSSAASMEIKKIEIARTNFIYDDKSIPILIEAQGLDYTGNGDLTKSLFDLYSKMAIDTFSLVYAGTPYVLAKKLEGDLITKINTKSLSFIFQKNDLRINALPVQLNGRFGFLDNGYDMSFKLQSLSSRLHDVITALPPAYLKWLDKTVVKGTADVNATLEGKYIAATNTMPDITFNLKIRDGYISHDKAPAPISHLYLDFQSKLPGFDMDRFYVNIDSLFFNLDKDYFSTVAKLQGIREPDLHLRLNSDLDLAKWARATGMPGLHIKGRLNTHIQADGKYTTGVVYKGGLRKTRDTVITSIPNFNIRASLTNGFFRLDTLPQGINNVHLELNATCTDHQVKHVNIAVNNINAEVLHNFIRGYIHLKNGTYPYMDANLSSVLNLSDIASFYPLHGLQLAGRMNINARVKGSIIPAKRQLPVSTVKIGMNNGFVQTAYYPHPLKNVHVNALISSSNSSMRSLKVELKPVSFVFEGQPFMLRADMRNFDNLKYNIQSKGTIDIGRIYQVFSQKGLDVTGKIKTNLSLQGTQNDAMAGRYARLHNSGTMSVEKIQLRSELFPKPLLINSGLFRFKQDKMWFDKFYARYGRSTIVLNGFLQNVIGYATEKNQPLKGRFNFSSPYILADEFMVFADQSATAKPSANTTSGVVMVPPNLDLQLNANAGKISFKGLEIKDFKGGMHIGSNSIALDSVAFRIIDAPIAMTAHYNSISPVKARFDYHINAKEFDIHKAYEKVEMVRDMMSSAKNVQGIIGLDYQLSGRLNKDMYPVLASLKGNGVLSVKKVKLKGFKLFNALSKSTNHDKMKDPDLSQIDIKSSITNNILTIERTKMKVSLLRPRFEGQVSLDGKLNLTGRLGLPPFGIFGIPFTVTGTQENPKIHLRHGKDQDKLEEEADKEE